MTDDRRPFRITPRLILGLFIALAGTLLLLDRFGVLDTDDYFLYWPLAFVLVGVAKLFQPGGQGRGFGLVLIIVFGWLLLNNVGYADFDWEYVFPALLVLLGLTMLVGEITRRSRRPRGAVDASSETHGFALLGGIRHSSTARDFQGGSANAILGSCEIDLRDAAIGDGEAVIDTFALWGGIEILVPESWAVSLQGMPILGSFEDLTRPPAGGSKERLVIRGLALMGGVEVRNAPKRER